VRASVCVRVRECICNLPRCVCVGVTTVAVLLCCVPLTVRVRACVRACCLSLLSVHACVRMLTVTVRAFVRPQECPSQCIPGSQCLKEVRSKHAEVPRELTASQEARAQRGPQEACGGPWQTNDRPWIWTSLF
jgi:hypothetical protein